MAASDPLYRITSQRESSRIAPGGGFESIIVVSFVTRSGASASVDIPKRTYTPDEVRAEVEQLATAMEDVHNS